jgi:PleD family two-component response regulator
MNSAGRSAIPLPKAVVLLLDDNDDSRVAHARDLRDAGFDVTEVADSRSALDVAPNVRPHVIIVRFDPGSRDDRLNVCQQLKADRRTQTVPVLLLSETNAEEDLRLTTEAGALALTVIPPDRTKLIAAVHGVLAVKQSEQLRASLQRPGDVPRSA